MLSPYSCVAEPVRKQTDACATENGRIRHVAAIEKGVNIDTSTPQAYIAALLAAELACNGFIFRNVNGTYDGGAATMGKGRGDEPERVVGRQHGAEFVDFEYVENEQFWNSMVGRSKNYNWHLITASRGWPIEDNNVSVDPKAPITDDVKSEIEGNIGLKWSNNGLLISRPIDVTPLSLPAGLTFTAIEETGGGAETITGTKISVPAGALLSVNLLIPGAVTFAPKDGSTALPGWLTLTDTGRLEGTAPAGAPVLLNLLLRGENACGLGVDVPVVVSVLA